MIYSVFAHEVKKCRYLNISVTNVDIRWSFWKRGGHLEGILAKSAAVLICKSFSQVLLLANQRARPVKRVRAGRVRRVPARAVRARLRSLLEMLKYLQAQSGRSRSHRVPVQGNCRMARLPGFGLGVFLSGPALVWTAEVGQTL